MTNLGALLQQALAAQQTAQQPAEAPAEEAPEAAEAEGSRKSGLCADCWNALTFKDGEGRQLARCGKDLWVKTSFSYDDLNNNKIRRWYVSCPEYDDSE
jgi:hypothetical protein